MVSADTPVARLKNLGPTSSAQLAQIGVHTAGDIEKLGVIETVEMLRMKGFSVSALMAYALQGALLDVHWNALPEPLKVSLREACRASK